MTRVLVKHLMTAPVVSFFAEQTMPLAEEVMRLKHMRHLPVIDDRQHLVGLLSHRDLLAAQISTQTGLDREARNAVQANVKIGEVMTRDVMTVLPDVPASVAAATLLTHKFGCLPVVDLAGVLIGILTENDLLRYAVRVLQTTD
jgi:CBS domain-containing membrane protein